MLEKGSLWEDDIARLRRAIEVADHPEVVACSMIRQLLDVSETEGEAGEFGYPGSFAAIWEWADEGINFFAPYVQGKMEVVVQVEGSSEPVFSNRLPLTIRGFGPVKNDNLRGSIRTGWRSWSWRTARRWRPASGRST